MNGDNPPALGWIRFGTSSFSEKDWVGPFYPENTEPAQFLSYYSRQFDTVEIDASYYGVPAVKSVEAWKAKTPKDFVISAKFPRSIVHAGKDAAPDPNAVLNPDTTYSERDKFLEVMSRLKERLGVLVLQFPYFRPEMFPAPEAFFAKLDKFLTDLPKGFRYGVEVRNRGWFNRNLADLCRRHQVALVLVDQTWMPMPDEVKRFDWVTADFTYVRLLGDRKRIEELTKTWDREIIDQTPKLERWADVLVGLQRRPVNAYVYVNNHYAGHAPATARKLQQLFIARGGILLGRTPNA